MGLVEARAAVHRFRGACEREPLVVAAFLGGSHAAGTADEASDVDIYVVAPEDGYARLWEQRRSFLEAWATPVLLVDTVDFEGLGFDMLHFILDDGVWGELAFGSTANFRTLHGGPHRILVDKVRLIDGVTFPLYVPSEAERRGEAERALGWFWLDFMSLLKSLLRDRRLATASYAASLRRHCSTLLEAGVGVGLELPVELLRTRLGETVTGPGRDKVVRAAGALAELHREVGAPVAERLGLVYPTDAAEAGAAKLRALLRTPD